MTSEPVHTPHGYRALVLRPAPAASSEARRRVLCRTGRRDTKPEIALRRELHRRGLRFLVDATPDGTSRRRRADIVLRGARIAVLVHGCFWHGCPEHYHAPKANAAWWQRKLESVLLRDADTLDRLADAGWLPFVVWEHEDMAEVADTLLELVRTRQRPPGRGRRSAGARAAT